MSLLKPNLLLTKLIMNCCSICFMCLVSLKLPFTMHVITSFPALSVFMFIYVRILLLLFVCLNAE